MSIFTKIEYAYETWFKRTHYVTVGDRWKLWRRSTSYPLHRRLFFVFQAIKTFTLMTQFILTLFRLIKMHKNVQANTFRCNDWFIFLKLVKWKVTHYIASNNKFCWRILLFFTYAKIEYVRIRTYLSKNRIRMIRMLEHWFEQCRYVRTSSLSEGQANLLNMIVLLCFVPHDFMTLFKMEYCFITVGLKIKPV